MRTVQEAFRDIYIRFSGNILQTESAIFKLNYLLIKANN